MMSLSANYRPFLRCFQGQPESRFCVMKFGRDVTVDDGGNYVTFLLTYQYAKNPELCNVRCGDEVGLE